MRRAFLLKKRFPCWSSSTSARAVETTFDQSPRVNRRNLSLAAGTTVACFASPPISIAGIVDLLTSRSHTITPTILLLHSQLLSSSSSSPGSSSSSKTNSGITINSKGISNSLTPLQYSSLSTSDLARAVTLWLCSANARTAILGLDDRIGKFHDDGQQLMEFVDALTRTFSGTPSSALDTDSIKPALELLLSRIQQHIITQAAVTTPSSVERNIPLTPTPTTVVQWMTACKLLHTLHMYSPQFLASTSHIIQKSLAQLSRDIASDSSIDTFGMWKEGSSFLSKHGDVATMEALLLHIREGELSTKRRNQLSQRAVISRRDIAEIASNAFDGGCSPTSITNLLVGLRPRWERRTKKGDDVITPTTTTTTERNSSSPPSTSPSSSFSLWEETITDFIILRVLLRSLLVSHLRQSSLAVITTTTTTSANASHEEAMEMVESLTHSIIKRFEPLGEENHHHNNNNNNLQEQYCTTQSASHTQIQDMMQAAFGAKFTSGQHTTRLGRLIVGVCRDLTWMMIPPTRTTTMTTMKMTTSHNTIGNTPSSTAAAALLFIHHFHPFITRELHIEQQFHTSSSSSSSSNSTTSSPSSYLNNSSRNKSGFEARISEAYSHAYTNIVKSSSSSSSSTSTSSPPPLILCISGKDAKKDVFSPNQIRVLQVLGKPKINVGVPMTRMLPSSSSSSSPAPTITFPDFEVDILHEIAYPNNHNGSVENQQKLQKGGIPSSSMLMMMDHSPKSFRIAVEIDGPTHFLPSSMLLHANHSLSSPLSAPPIPVPMVLSQHEFIQQQVYVKSRASEWESRRTHHDFLRRQHLLAAALNTHHDNQRNGGGGVDAIVSIPFWDERLLQQQQQINKEKEKKRNNKQDYIYSSAARHGLDAVVRHALRQVADIAIAKGL